MRITAKDSVHILHYDTSPSLLVQVKGRKLVRTVPSHHHIPDIHCACCCAADFVDDLLRLPATLQLPGSHLQLDSCIFAVWT